MEYEASLLAGEASLLCPRSLTAPAQGQRHAFMTHYRMVCSYRCMVTLTHGVTILKSAI